MRKLVNLTLIFVAVAVLFPSCVSKKKFTELLSSKETVDAALAQSQSKVKTLEGEKEELMTAKADLESQNATLTSDLNATKSKLDGAEQNLATAQTNLTKAEKALSEKETSIRGVFSSFQGSGLNVSERDNRLYVALSEPILFRSGSTRIQRKYRDAINNIAEVLKANPNIQIQVEGHSDNAKFIDGAGNNWSLSMNRAMNTLNMLLRAGVSPNQLSAVGRGEFAPASADDPNSADARAQNRRVEFLVVPSMSSLKDDINP